MELGVRPVKTYLQTLCKDSSAGCSWLGVVLFLHCYERRDRLLISLHEAQVLDVGGGPCCFSVYLGAVDLWLYSVSVFFSFVRLYSWVVKA